VFTLKATGCAATVVLLSTWTPSCRRAPEPRTQDPLHGPARLAPVVSPSDPSWPDVGRRCGPAEPVWEPSPDSLARQRPHDRNAQWAAIAREAPGGFAGLYEEDGRLVVLLTDTLQKQAALPAVARRIPGRGLDIQRARVVQARWNFAQLYDWWAHIASHPTRFEGLTVYGINERDNRLVYGFRDSTSIRAAAVRIKSLGLPCYLVAFVVRAPFRRS
jgi:hypothetical protein